MTVRIAILSILLALTAAREARGQQCGIVSYLVRDTIGRVMSPEQMKELSVSINGVPLRLRGRGADLHYEFDVVRHERGRDTTRTERAMKLTNPLVVGNDNSLLTPCAEVNDLVLAYGGRVMRMHLGIPRVDRNREHEFEAPPFQDGAYYPMFARGCEGGELPPRMGDRTMRRCVSPAAIWDGPRPEQPWHFYFSLRTRLSSFVRLSPDACRSRGTFAITSPAGLAAFWEAHPEATAGAPQPLVDFRRQFLLAVYQSERFPPYDPFRSLHADSLGDLTFLPSENGARVFGACGVILLQLYREGVNSIAGKPLPPAPR